MVVLHPADGTSSSPSPCRRDLLESLIRLPQPQPCCGGTGAARAAGPGAARCEAIEEAHLWHTLLAWQNSTASMNCCTAATATSAAGAGRPASKSDHA